LPPELVPVFLGYTMKSLDNLRIKLPSDPLIQLFGGSLIRASLAINAVAGDSVERISD
jgi:hypothetical protein